MFVLAVKIRCRPEKSQIAFNFFSSFVPKAKSEAGCEFYELFRETGNDNVFFFFEKWASEQDYRAHLETDYIKEFRSRYNELLSTKNEVTYLQKP